MKTRIASDLPPPKRGGYTVDDYRATPEGPPWIELIDGHLLEEPSPGTGHQEVSVNLTLLLGTFVRANALGRILAAPMDVYLSKRDVLQPDLLFVSAGRLDIIRRDGVHGPPDLVVEIVSPSSARRDTHQKRRIYAEAGVREYWLVEPEGGWMMVYDFQADRERHSKIVSGCGAFESPLFPGLVIKVEAVLGGTHAPVRYPGRLID